MRKTRQYALVVSLLVFGASLCFAQSNYSGLSTGSKEPIFPECEEPLGVHIAEVGGSSIQIGWDEPRDSYGDYFYQIRFREEGTSLWEEVEVRRRMGVELTNLLPERTYVFQIRRACLPELNLYSDWIDLDPVRITIGGGDRQSSSEICVQMKKAAIQQVAAEGIVITWDGPPASQGGYWYQVRHRFTQNGIVSGWIENDVLSGNHFVFTNLQNSATYEFEVRLLEGPISNPDFICAWLKAGQVSVNTGEVEDEESEPEVTLPAFDCGDPFSGVSVDHSTSLATAAPGDFFNINGFPVLLTQVSGGNGIFYGEGIIPLPFKDQTVRVSFSGISVNAAGQVYAGTVTAISDAPGNYPDFTTNTISIGSGICLPTQQTEGFDDNGIHSATGQPWDENGFGLNGQYVQQPPYPGWSLGDPYDPAYDPNGFDADGIHKETGTEYNPDGCNQQGLDINGQPCDPSSGNGPYYWEDENGNPPTQAGINLASQLEPGLKSMLEDVWNFYRDRVVDSINVTRIRCDGLRNDMDVLLQSLGYQRTFILGENDEYFNEGMSEFFTAEPTPLQLNIERDPQHEELEEKHVDLWHCDTGLMKFLCSRDYIDDQLENAALDDKVMELLDKIQRFSEAEAQTYSDTDNLIAWIQGIVTEDVKLYCNVGNAGIGSAEEGSYLETGPSSDTGRWAYSHSIRNSSPILSPAEGTGLMLADNGEDNTAFLQSLELEKEDISFLYQQGFEYIGGVHRAFFLETLAEYKTLQPPSGGSVLPVVVEKEVLGKMYKIYLDNIVFTPTGASLDAYFILDVPTSGDQLVFRALNIPFGPTGMDVNTRLELDTDVSIRINNAAQLTFKGTPATFVEWDCEGFAGMGVDAEIEFCRNYVKPLNPSTLEVLPDPERVRAYFAVQMPAWGEFIAQLDFDPFAINGLEDVKWEVTNATLDFSESETPSNIAFPVNYGSPFVSSAGLASPLWKGFYLQELTVTLPENLTAQQTGQQSGTGAPVSVSVQDVIIDDRGVTGKASVANLMPLSDGRSLGGWAFSVDTFSISVVANVPAGVGFNGLIHVPILRGGPGNDGPVTEGDCLRYQAVVLSGNQYNFSIHPASNSDFHIPLWLGEATIDDNSWVSITYSDGDFLAEAGLFGNLDIHGQANDLNMEMPSIRFEGVRISNQAPYFKPGNWSFPGETGAKVGGFGITLESVSLMSIGSGEEVALGFGALINLVSISDSISVTVGGGFQLNGELDQSGDRHKWNFTDFNVNDVLIETGWAGVNYVRGHLSFYENDPQFGNGFRGMVSAGFSGLGSQGGDSGFGVDAVAQFGSKDDFRYFFIDAMAHINPGIPIGPAINIRGFGGGAYFRMSRQAQGSYVDLPAVATGAPALPPLGASLSGITYVPDSNAGLGLKATVALAAQKEEVFSANTTFEILFNNGGGLNEIHFLGNARFMSELNVNAPPFFDADSLAIPDNGAQVSAYVEISYDFQARALDANFAVYMNVLGGMVTGAGNGGRLGRAVMHFSPDTWYINIGTPSNRNGMKINIPVIGNIFTFETYLNIGNQVPPMPELPSNVASITGAGNFMANENLRASGSGFAFGARAVISTGDLEFLVFYASFTSDIGFDLMLQDYGDAVCAQSGEPIGINGWYASGQAWAFMEGEIGIKVNIFGSERRYDILSIGAGAVLQAKLPNPFWARGSVGGRYRILGGLIKGNCNFQVTIGEACQIIGADDPAENLEVILHVTPGDDSDNMPVHTRPNVSFNLPLDQSFQMTGPASDEPSDYRAELEHIRLLNLSSNSLVIGEVKMGYGNLNLEFQPFNMLPPNDSFELEVKVRILKDGQPFDTETKTVTFTTGPALEAIPEGNVLASYPLDGQYNFYKDEKPDHTGYVLLKVGQPGLFFNVPDEYTQLVRLTDEDGTTHAVSLEYDPVGKMISFPLPGEALQNDKLYKLEIVNVPTSAVSGESMASPATQTAGSNVASALTPTQTVTPSTAAGQSNLALNFSQKLSEGFAGGDTPSEKVLYQVHFRTSVYNTFMEKLNAIEQNQEYATVGNSAAIICRPLIPEPFDKFELGADAEVDPLVECRAQQISSSFWYQNDVYPVLYMHFPGTVNFFVGGLLMDTKNNSRLPAGHWNGVSRPSERM